VKIVSDRSCFSEALIRNEIRLQNELQGNMDNVICCHVCREVFPSPSARCVLAAHHHEAASLLPVKTGIIRVHHEASAVSALLSDGDD
jgi:hypothetical protein